MDRNLMDATTMQGSQAISGQKIREEAEGER